KPKLVTSGMIRHHSGVVVGWLDHRPLAHGVRPAAIEAARLRIARSAVRTGCSAREDVKGLLAVSASPTLAQRRRSVAGRTGKTLAPRYLRHLQKYFGLLQSCAAVGRALG